MYFSLALLTLNPFVFLSSHNPWITYPSIIAVTFIGIWGLIKFFERPTPSALGHLIFIGSVFALSLVSGTLIWLVNGTNESDTFLYFYSFLIVPILPVSIYILWLMYFDLSKRVSVSTEHQQTPDNSVQKLFRITNNKDQVILESPIERIIAFEANDNYVNTYHLLDDGSVDRVMYRISLKKITELLSQIDSEFLRVHKSYLINPQFIEKIKGKSQAYRIELTHLSTDIPVSRTFDVSSIQTKEN